MPAGRYLSSDRANISLLSVGYRVDIFLDVQERLFRHASRPKFRETSLMGDFMVRPTTTVAGRWVTT